jgi:hypothetical protein
MGAQETGPASEPANHMAGRLWIVLAALLGAATVALFTADNEGVQLPEPLTPPHFSDETLQNAYGSFETAVLRVAVEPPALAPPEPPPAGIAVDDAWGQLKRRSKPSAAHMLMNYSAKIIELDDLVRHRDLNPRDIYLTVESRVSLAAWLRPQLEALLELDMAYSEVISQEMNKLIILGTKKPLRFNDEPHTRRFLESRADEARIPHERRFYVDGDSIEVFYGVGNTLYAYRRGDAAGVTPLRDAKRYARIEFADRVLRWFRNIEAINGAEFASVLEQAMKIAEEAGR